MQVESSKVESLKVAGGTSLVRGRVETFHFPLEHRAEMRAVHFPLSVFFN
jgi:hypothetical protein